MATTIYCSQCGTQNKEASKFCSNCGARLALPTGLICPMCSTPNPLEGVFCNSCGARLMPLIAGSAPAESAPPIKGLSLPAKTQPGEPTGLPKEEGQDWLANLRSSASVEPAEVEVEEELPAAPVAEPAAAQGEEPSWVDDLRRAVGEGAAPAATIAAEAEPSWTRDERVAAELPAPAGEPEAEEQSWVKRLRDSAERGEAPEAEKEIARARGLAPSDDIVAREELPDWLQESEGARTIAAPAPMAEETTAPRAEAETPDWLRMTTPTESAEERPAPIPRAEAETPDWLRMAMSPETAEEQPAEPWLEPAVPTEIPAWVAELKPAELAPLPISSSAPLETSGPLAGLRGILPLADAIAQPHALTQPASAPNGRRGAQLFEAILAPPAATKVTVLAKPRRANVMRWFLYLLIALAVIVPFFIPTNLATAGLRFGAPAAEFYDALQTLPANSTVLLSFDYDAGAAGEMDLLATAVARHLMRQRVKIVAVSAVEVGPQIAQRVLESAALASNYRYGVDYVNAGYLAGAEAGLAQFAVNGLPANARDYAQKQPLAQMQITSAVKSPRDFALVIELAGTEDALKLWMEQVQARAGVRIAAATSAAVEPKARTYKDAKQLVGLVSGLAGAAQYEVLTNQPGQAVVRVNAQSVAMAVLVLAVILGNVAGLLAWVGKRRGG